MATCKLVDGEVILQEEPWIYSVASREIHSRCYGCLRNLNALYATLSPEHSEASSNTSGARVRGMTGPPKCITAADGRVNGVESSAKIKNRCSRCRLVRYCSTACQSADWKTKRRHKLECYALRHLPTNTIPPNHFLLMLKIILSQVAEPWEEEEDRVLPTKHDIDGNAVRTYADLISHADHISADVQSREYAVQLRAMLFHYVSLALMRNNLQSLNSQTDYQHHLHSRYSVDSIVEMLGKVKCNSFSIMDEGMMVECGVGIYLQASQLNHSCQPNASQIFHGTLLRIKANTDILGRNLDQVKISYIDRMLPLHYRRQILKETYYFVCCCPRCLHPEKDAEMFGLKCANVRCNMVIPSDERAHECCTSCGSTLGDVTLRLEQYKDHVQIIMERIGSHHNNDHPHSSPGPDDDDYSRSISQDQHLFHQAQQLMHPTNPLLALFATYLAHRLHGQLSVSTMDGPTATLSNRAMLTSRSIQSWHQLDRKGQLLPSRLATVAELFVQAAVIYRKWLPLCDGVRAFVLYCAIMSSWEYLRESGMLMQSSHLDFIQKIDLINLCTEAKQCLLTTMGEEHEHYLRIVVCCQQLLNLLTNTAC